MPVFRVIKISRFKVWTLLVILSFLIGATFIDWIGGNMKESGLESREYQKEIESQLAISSFQKELDKFTYLVMGIRNMIKSLDDVPTALQLQSLIQDQLKDMNFHNSIVISYLDTNHIFQYSVTKSGINENNLAGKAVG